MYYTHIKLFVKLTLFDAYDIGQSAAHNNTIPQLGLKQTDIIKWTSTLTEKLKYT